MAPRSSCPSPRVPDGGSAFLFLCSGSAVEGRPPSIDWGGMRRRDRPAPSEARVRLGSGAVSFGSDAQSLGRTCTTRVEARNLTSGGVF